MKRQREGEKALIPKKFRGNKVETRVKDGTLCYYEPSSSESQASLAHSTKIKQARKKSVLNNSQNHLTQIWIYQQKDMWMETSN